VLPAGPLTGRAAMADEAPLVFAARRDPVRDGSIFGLLRANAAAPAAPAPAATPQATLCAPTPCIGPM